MPRCYDGDLMSSLDQPTSNIVKDGLNASSMGWEKIDNQQYMHRR